MFHGDTLYMGSEVIQKRESKSNPSAGLVTFRHIGRNQQGIIVIEFERIALMRKKVQSAEF
jgi:acyl dehydratase